MHRTWALRAALVAALGVLGLLAAGPLMVLWLSELLVLHGPAVERALVDALLHLDLTAGQLALLLGAGAVGVALPRLLRRQLRPPVAVVAYALSATGVLSRCAAASARNRCCQRGPPRTAVTRS